MRTVLRQLGSFSIGELYKSSADHADKTADYTERMIRRAGILAVCSLFGVPKKTYNPHRLRTGRMSGNGGGI